MVFDYAASVERSAINYAGWTWNAETLIEILPLRILYIGEFNIMVIRTDYLRAPVNYEKIVVIKIESGSDVGFFRRYGKNILEGSISEKAGEGIFLVAFDLQFAHVAESVYLQFGIVAIPEFSIVKVGKGKTVIGNY